MEDYPSFWSKVNHKESKVLISQGKEDCLVKNINSLIKQIFEKLQKNRIYLKDSKTLVNFHLISTQQGIERADSLLSSGCDICVRYCTSLFNLLKCWHSHSRALTLLTQIRGTKLAMISFLYYRWCHYQVPHTLAPVYWGLIQKKHVV